MECDGQILEVPDDIEGLLLLNINSYMGGVDLWASGAPDAGNGGSAKQSFCDGRLEARPSLQTDSCYRRVSSRGSEARLACSV